MERILVVDDDPMITKLVKVNLELGDYTVEEIWDGDTAIKAMKNDAPDLLILDIMMPCTDGWDVLGMVRGTEGLKELPVIILTAKVHDEEVIQGLEMGADDYITKPFNPVTLSDRVKFLLESTPQERLEGRKRKLASLIGMTRADSTETV